MRRRSAGESKVQAPTQTNTLVKAPGSRGWLVPHFLLCEGLSARRGCWTQTATTSFAIKWTKYFLGSRKRRPYLRLVSSRWIVLDLASSRTSVAQAPLKRPEHLRSQFRYSEPAHEFQGCLPYPSLTSCALRLIRP